MSNTIDLDGATYTIDDLVPAVLDFIEAVREAFSSLAQAVRAAVSSLAQAFVEWAQSPAAQIFTRWLRRHDAPFSKETTMRRKVRRVALLIQRRA